MDQDVRCSVADLLGAMDVNLPPGVVASFPDSRFTAGGGYRFIIDDSLRQSGVAENDAILAKPAQVWTHHGHGDGGCARAGVSGVTVGSRKVEAMKRQAFDEMSSCFSFEAGEVVMAMLLIGIPVATADAIQHLLVLVDDLLIVSGDVAHGYRLITVE